MLKRTGPGEERWEAAAGRPGASRDSRSRLGLGGKRASFGFFRPEHLYRRGAVLKGFQRSSERAVVEVKVSRVRPPSPPRGCRLYSYVKFRFNGLGGKALCL